MRAVRTSRRCATSPSAACSNGQRQTTPDRIALIEGRPDREQRRQWTYAELYAQAQRTAKALRARFEPGERVAIWAQNLPEWIMVEFGAAMAGVILVTVNPGLRAGGGRIHPEPVALGRPAGGARISRHPHARHRARTRAEVQGTARDHLLRRLGCVSRVRRQGQPAAAGGQIHRRGDDPVHLRHHRLSEGRVAASSRARQQRRAHQRPLPHDRRRRAGDDDAAVPHRRLRLLRDRRGVEAHDAGAGRGVRPGPRDPAGAGLSHQRACSACRPC